MNDEKPLTSLRACFLLTPLLLALAAPASGKSIGKDQVNVRAQPDLKSAILYSAPLAYPLEIQKEQGKWLYCLDWLNNSGWVYKSFVSNIDTAIVLVEKANIRSAAALKADVVANAEQGEIYTILARDNNWVKLGYFQTGAAIGWIRDDLVFGE
jgi:SH3-like domain-containing protein